MPLFNIIFLNVPVNAREDWSEDIERPRNNFVTGFGGSFKATSRICIPNTRYSIGEDNPIFATLHG